MSAMTQARRLVKVAALGSGGLGAAGVLFTGIVMGQAMLARRTIPLAESPPPRCDGRYGSDQRGVPIRMMMLGDSSAAGYGVEAARDTPGALLAAGLAEQLRRPVDLRCLAVVGAESRHLAPQVRQAAAQRPDVAVILVGGNDVTHRAKVPLAVRYLVEAVRALRAVGTEVIVGTCPDLGTIQPIQPPLRWLTGHWSRQMAAAQTIGAVSAGARSVSLGDLLGPTFAAQPDRMFARDRFHPSAAGYAAAAAALLPSVVAALTPTPDAVPSGENVVCSLPEAAVAAAHQAGTEVSPARPVQAGTVNGAAVNTGTVNAGEVNAGAVNAGEVNAGTVNGAALNLGAVNGAAVNGGAVAHQLVAGRLAELRQRVWRPTRRPTGPAAGGWAVGSPDAALPDASRPDAGRPDAGRPDAGLPDAGLPDAGRPDAGLSDVGLPDQEQRIPEATGEQR